MAQHTVHLLCRALSGTAIAKYMNRTVQLVAPVAASKPQTHSYAGYILFTLGIALAFGGQWVLLNTIQNSPDEGWMQALAVMLLIVGAWLFGTNVRESTLALSRFDFPRSTTRVSRFVWRNRWAVAWLAVSVVLGVLAISAFIKDGENQFVRLAWLASLAALLIAPIKDVRLRLPQMTRQKRVYLAVLAVLVVVAFVMRVYKLTLLPYNVDGDFAEFGGIARSLVTGQQQHIFAYDNWGGMPMLGYLPSWLTMSLLGDNLFGLYASGVVEGLVVIVGVYLLGRDLFYARVGLFAAAVLTVSYTHLLASRQSNFIDPVPFLVFSLYFLLVGLRQGRLWALVISGALTALCVQMYFSGRIVVLLVGFLLFYFLVLRPPWLRMRRAAVLLWVLAILITLGPMLVVFARDSAMLMARSSGIFVLNPSIATHLQNKYHVTFIPTMLFEQARRTVLLFNYYVDTGPQFSFKRPFLDPVTAPLFVIGMGYALMHRRRLGDVLLPVWVVLGAVFGSFLVSDAPSWSRLMILLPPTALLAARALDLLYAQVSGGLVPPGKYMRFIAPAAFAVLFIAVGILNWNTYVEVKGSYASQVTRMARYLDAQSPSTHGYLVSDLFPYNVRELRFLVPGRLVASLTPEKVTGNITRVGSPTLVILTNEQGAVLQKLTRLYPEGFTETHLGNAPDDIAFYVFRLP